MFNLLEALHPSSVGSVADILPWKRIVQDGVIQTKRGGYIASFVLVGPDSAATSPAEQDFLCEQVTEHLNRRAATRTWSVFSNRFRVPSTSYPDNGAFASRVNRIIDHARRLSYQEEGTHYESRAVLTLHYAPNTTKKAKIENWTSNDGMSNEDRALKTFLHGVDEAIRFLVGYVSLTQLKLRVVSDVDGRECQVDDQLSFLYYCLTGRTAALRPPADGMFVSDYLSVLAANAGDEPTIGDDVIRVVRINGFPEYTTPALFKKLDSFAIPFRVSMRAVLLDKEQALSEIKSYERNHATKVVPFLSRFAANFGLGQTQVSTKALRLERDAQAAWDAVDHDQKRFTFFTFNVVLRGPSAKVVDEYAQTLISYLHDLHFPAALEKQNAARAFFGTMPGDIYSNLHRPPISTRNLAHMLPLTGIWPGVEIEPCKYLPPNSPPLFFGKTTGTAPFRFSLHAQDTNGHVAIVGPSGAGKSTLLALMISQFERYAGAQGIVIDKGRSLMTLAKAMESDGVAKHYELLTADNEAGGTVGFCPFAYIKEGPAEREYALAFVETLMRLKNVTPTVEQRKKIRAGIDLLMQEPKISLMTLMPLIEDVEVKNIIRDYLKSAVGPLIGAEADVDDSAPFVFFETEELSNLKDDTLSTPVFMHIVHLLERRTRQHRPTMLVMDEAWELFKDPYMRRVIQSLFNVARKKNLAIIFSIPSLQDASEDASLLITILQQCLTRVFLPNHQANTEDFIPLYKKVGLTDHEIHTIARTLKRTLDYYYLSPVGRRPFQLELSKLALAFLGVDGSDKINDIRELIAKNPHNWVADYLRKLGLENWASIYEKCSVGAVIPSGEALAA